MIYTSSRGVASLMARVDGDAVVLERRGAALRRLRELVTSIVPRDVSLVDEPIAERREEARREEGELRERD